MKKAIIFDFNRTLFDPERQILLPGAKSVLTDALFKGFELFLLSRGTATGIDVIKETGIGRVFTKVVISEKKNVCVLKKLVREYSITITTSYVIGDSIKGEIVIGNKLGFNTIWLKRGKFASIKPKKRIEKPTAIITNITDLKKIIR